MRIILWCTLFLFGTSRGSGRRSDTYKAIYERATVGAETAELLEKMFADNPKITPNEALEALESSTHPPPPYSDITSWLKYRRASRRFAGTAHSSSSSSESVKEAERDQEQEEPPISREGSRKRQIF